MRFTSRCTMASTEPTTRVSTASTHTIGRQSDEWVANVEKNTRNSAAKPAALEADAMKAVTGDGAPW